MNFLQRTRLKQMKITQSLRRSAFGFWKRNRSDGTEGGDGTSSSRTVRPLDAPTRQRFQKNQITNSKYTIWNFIFLNISEQFSRPLNCYFLLIAILQFVRVIAPVNPMSTVLPLVFAFALTAVKEGVDDIKRHQQDHLVNNRTYILWN